MEFLVSEKLFNTLPINEKLFKRIYSLVNLNNAEIERIFGCFTFKYVWNEDCLYKTTAEKYVNFITSS